MIQYITIPHGKVVGVMTVLKWRNGKESLLVRGRRGHRKQNSLHLAITNRDMFLSVNTKSVRRNDG